MHVNETGHAQRLNMLKERPRKWFFREQVDFLASLAFVVNCGHTIDLQQVQAKRFSFVSSDMQIGWKTNDVHTTVTMYAHHPQLTDHFSPNTHCLLYHSAIVFHVLVKIH